MTNIFEIFNPGDRHWREHKDFEKVHVFTTKKGGRGPMMVDLDDGTMVLPTAGSRQPDEDRPVRRGSRRATDADSRLVDPETAPRMTDQPMTDQPVTDQPVTDQADPTSPPTEPEPDSGHSAQGPTSSPQTPITRRRRQK